MRNTSSVATPTDDGVYPEEEADGFSVSCNIRYWQCVVTATWYPQHIHTVPHSPSFHERAYPVLQTSPQVGAVRGASSVTAGSDPRPEGVSVDSAVHHSGRNAVPQLHDSATSEYYANTDHDTTRVFLTRKDTANIYEALPVLPNIAKTAAEQAETAVAQMAPFEARKAFLLGPPKPACCPERAKTVEGINKLWHADDPEIGTPLAVLPWLAV